jgi:2-keto-4-pentenoate hydratase/2-oxohepta-3-ene-1,7-dioic acid hydratase in catechol pathway
MTRWVRFSEADKISIGALENDTISAYEGDLFASPKPTGRTVQLNAVKVLTPCEPGKMVCLWNNFHALATKLNLKEPAEPLYFFKAQTAFYPTGLQIPRPKSYSGRVVFEGELGIVVGKRCVRVSEADARDHIFGYTCVNDVTAFDLLNRDPSFAQWARCKSFDGFGVFGPVIATGLDPDSLVIRSVLNGEERQNYPVADMFFKPYRLVSLISQDLTLLPGDIVSCGTSLGAGTMKPGSRIEIIIDGVGTLSNTME